MKLQSLDQLKVLKNNDMPEHLRQYTGRLGTENIGQDDVLTPRLLLLQALSPQLEEFDTLKAGEFFHSGAEVGLGDEVTLIPLYLTKAYTLWRPRPEGGILARSRDGIRWDRTGQWTDIKLKGGKTVTWAIRDLDCMKSGVVDWGSSDPENPDSQPAATLAYNLAVLLPEHERLGPAVLQMQRSQVKVAKKLQGRLKLQQVPLFGLQIPLCSFKEQGAEGPFYQIKLGKFEYVQDASLCGRAKALFDMFQEQGVVVKEDQPVEESHATDEEVPY